MLNSMTKIISPEIVTPKVYGVISKWLIFFFTLMLFLHIPVYVEARYLNVIIPLYWLIAAGLASMFMLPIFLGNKTRVILFLTNPLLKWILGYVIVTLIWYVFSDQSSDIFHILIYRILNIFIILLFLFMFCLGEFSRRTAIQAIIIATLFSVVANIIGFIFPNFFTADYLGVAVGRASGFYLNPNESGAALVLGLILTIQFIPKRFRVAYVFFVLMGIVLTFSRAAELSFLITIILFVQQRIVKIRTFIVVLLIFLLLFVQYNSAFIGYLSKIQGVNYLDIVSRNEWFLNSGTTLADSNVIGRQYVSTVAWQMFIKHPLLGNGIGSTELWREVQGVHNMYLYYMADFGLVGILILPLLILACLWRSQGEVRQMGIIFAVNIFTFAFFSHNITTDYFFLIGFSLIAILSQQSWNNSLGNNLLKEQDYGGNL